MTAYEHIGYESDPDGIATVRLGLDTLHGTHCHELLIEFADAMARAERDDDVRVVLLVAAADRRFDGAEPAETLAQRRFAATHQARAVGDRQALQGTPMSAADAGSGTASSQEIKDADAFSIALHWRNLRKVTIAVVRDEIHSLALSLAWGSDLIVADESAVFADVIATRLETTGTGYFAHPWEIGVRKAKELLLTGDAIDADEAYRLGMVSRVFASRELDRRSREYALRIADLPSAGALMIKEAVNQTQDNQGFYNSLKATFDSLELVRARANTAP